MSSPSSSSRSASSSEDADQPSSTSTTSSADANQEVDVDICGLDEGNYAAEFFSGNACLDLFLLDADAPPQRLCDLLAAAWDQDALTALKLVCHRHDVKRNSEGFVTAFTWMLQAHPRVLVDNLPVFAELGYVQDFVGILDHLLVAEDDKRREAATHVNLQPAPAGLDGAHDAHDDDSAHHAPTGLKRARQEDPGAGVGAGAIAPPAAAAVADRAPSASAGATAPAALLDVADSAPIDLEAASTVDPLYDTLYRAMSDYFVDRLRTDMGHLNNDDMSKITRAADRCSTMTSPFEQTTLLRLDIARRLLPNPNQEPVQLLFDLHRSVLFPLILILAAELEEPERRKVPEIILPHLIAAGFAKEAWNTKPPKKRGEITRKWRSMVDDLRGKGSLRNCIAVCDVSLDSLGSMKLLEVCVALGLLIAELSEAPWKNWAHAFSEGDGVHSLEGETSYPEKVEAIRKLKCNGRFNLRSVFEHAIVPPACMLRPEDMPPEDFDPKRVRRWSDDYRIVCDKFKEQATAIVCLGSSSGT